MMRSFLALTASCMTDGGTDWHPVGASRGVAQLVSAHATVVGWRAAWQRRRSVWTSLDAVMIV